MAKTDDLEGMTGAGVAPKKIKRLDNAIEKWRAIVEERMALTESEVDARDKVIEIMHEESVKSYPYWTSDDEQRLVVLDSTEKLKLKKAGTAEVKDGDDVDETD